MCDVSESFKLEFESMAAEVMRSYRARLPAVMAGLADRPVKGAKASAREALREHMREMHELAIAYGRLNPRPIVGS